MGKEMDLILKYYCGKNMNSIREVSFLRDYHASGTQ